MNATRNAVPDRRQINQHPHPDFSDAVAVTRFWRLVAILSPAECWLWRGDRDGQNYGVFYFRGRVRRAHELALSFTTGEARARELDTCHTCDVPPCCNPSHLRFDTRLSNVREMRERGRARSASKLTAEDVVLMRERRALGARQKDLASQFGITDGQVSMIVRGLRWKEAGGPIQTERKYVNVK